MFELSIENFLNLNFRIETRNSERHCVTKIWSLKLGALKLVRNGHNDVLMAPDQFLPKIG